MFDEGDVRRICLGLPGVTERETWGRPAWFAHTQVAREPTSSSERRDLAAGPARSSPEVNPAMFAAADGAPVAITQGVITRSRPRPVGGAAGSGASW